MFKGNGLALNMATSHYLNICWPSSLTHICGIRRRRVDTSDTSDTGFLINMTFYTKLCRQHRCASHILPMMTSWNGNIFHVTGLCGGNSPVTGEFPAKKPVMRSFDVFFDLRLYKWLSKQWRGWWFKAPSCPLWRHYNVSQKLNMSLVSCAWVMVVSSHKGSVMRARCPWHDVCMDCVICIHNPCICFMCR